MAVLKLIVSEVLQASAQEESDDSPDKASFLNIDPASCRTMSGSTSE
jgi:hypothetical protein